MTGQPTSHPPRRDNPAWRSLAIFLAFLLCSGAGLAAESTPAAATERFTVMTWNIWQGGRGADPVEGPRRIAKAILVFPPDLVAIQETYGSGALLAAETGYRFLGRGTNVSILSRFPIVEDISVDDPFRCVGALVELPDQTRVAFYSIWLPYAEDIWVAGSRAGRSAEALAAACEPSAVAIDRIERAIRERLKDDRYAGVPIILAGDMNAPSHLDYGEVSEDQYGIVVPWRATLLLAERGWRDAERDGLRHIDRVRDRTWSPRFPEQEADRIDMIHLLDDRRDAIERSEQPFRTEWVGRRDELQGGKGEAQNEAQNEAQILSDHAPVLVGFRRTEVAKSSAQLRVVTSNIRHGRGMDNEVNLERIAARLNSLNADVIALQEVDLSVARSGSVNQAAWLGSRLALRPAFGAFMALEPEAGPGRGRYGCAILSRHPIVATRSLRLPEGNEPRVALEVDVRLPDDTVVTIINVHFDWVDDDRFRFAQAERVVARIRELAASGRHGVLLGDLNDGPTSRTLALVRRVASEAAKPAGASATFPAPEPTQEIDYVFAWPMDAWVAEDVRVVDERVASDHRPVAATLRRVGSVGGVAQD
jgi:endonuclease/exonuclease/phosphatase family metal-dependent hydrolase